MESFAWNVSILSILIILIRNAKVVKKIVYMILIIKFVSLVLSKHPTSMDKNAIFAHQIMFGILLSMIAKSAVEEESKLKELVNAFKINTGINKNV